MKERPILFSTPMVQAIQKGEKTQTRRTPSLEKINNTLPSDVLGPRWGYDGTNVHGDHLFFDVYAASAGHEPPDCIEVVRCPYGVPGDRLWVRETWRSYEFGGTYYLADEPWNKGAGWKPSIFMPRHLSRITLEIISIRVQRIQEISEADCCAEMGCPAEWPGPGPEPYKRDLRGAFQILWDGINAKRGYGWDVNPWVFAIEFRRVDK